MTKERSYKAYSVSRGKFITDKISDGLHLSQVIKMYPEHVPSEKTVYNWKKVYPEFKTALDLAYQDLFFKKIDILDDASRELLEIVNALTAAMSKEEIAIFKARQEALRQRIDVLKFELAKLAPKICNDLKDTAHIAIAMPAITVINYSDREEKTICTQSISANDSLKALPQK